MPAFSSNSYLQEIVYLLKIVLTKTDEFNIICVQLKFDNNFTKTQNMNEKEKKELYIQLDELIQKNKDLPGPLIQILHGAQGIFGYLPVEVLEYTADKLGKPSSEVYGVATFYHLFHLKPKGKYQFKICLGTACYIRGGQMLVDVITEELDIEMGGITEDGLFSLEAVRCIGACGLAPVMLVNERVYDKLISPAKVRAAVNECKKMAAEENKLSA